MQGQDKIGKAFHNLRINRNISLKQVADENVSISQLSRFERGESDLSVSKFLIALSNMKIEMDEFMAMLQAQQPSENIDFMSRLIPLEYKRDVEGFRILRDQQRQKFQENPSVYQYHLNMILAQSFISKCDPQIPFPKEYLDEVADYLFMIEEWKTYELILIGNIYLFFDIPVLHRMGMEIMKRPETRGTTRTVAIITLLNIFETCLHRGALEEAGYYKDNIPSWIKDETRLYERNLYHFLVGLYEYKTGETNSGIELETGAESESHAESETHVESESHVESEAGIEKMRQAIQIYEWLGCKNLADNYKKDMEEYTETREIRK